MITCTSLILRSGRRPRLEGWQQAGSVRPSFETLASLAPQDEDGGRTTMRRLHDVLNGWSLTGVLALAVALMAFAIAAAHGFDVEGASAVIRATARTSLLLFCLAFSAAALFWFL